MSCILRHRGIQLILAYSCWARPAILEAGKGWGDMFLFLLFLCCHSFSLLSCPSLSSPLLSLLSLFPLSLGDDTKWPTRVHVSLNPNSISKKNPALILFTSWISLLLKILLGNLLASRKIILHFTFETRVSQRTTKPTRLVRPAKTQISLRIRAVWSESLLIVFAFSGLSKEG